MKKLTKLLFVAAFSLVFAGCGKKTTKTKSTTENKGTTNITTSSKKTKTTAKKTTQKKTTTIKTTQEKKEFVEINYDGFKQKVNQIDDSKVNYLKVTINGSIENDHEGNSKTYVDYVYRKDDSGTYLADDGGDTAFDYYIGNDLIKYAPNEDLFKYYISDDGKFKIVQETKLYIDGKIATMYYTFNKYGYLTSVETKDIKTGSIAMDYTNPIKNLVFDWQETDSFDGYDRITKDEALEITSSYSTTNKYIGAYVTGSYVDLKSGNSYSLTNQPSHYQEESSGYVPYDNTIASYIYGELNGFRTKYLFYADKTFYYKNSDNEIAIITYRDDSESNLHVLRTVKFNDWGYAKELKDKLVTEDEPSYYFIMADYEVEYLTTEPTITITLNAGLGTFSDGSKQKQVVTTPGKSINNLNSSMGYETPTLSGSSTGYGYLWYDENNKGYDSSKPIYGDKCLTYGFLDSDYSTTPTLSLSFKSGTTGLINFKIDYIDGENKGVLIIVGANSYYSSSNDIIFTNIYDTDATIWGAFNSITLSKEEGVYAEGNKDITTISCIRPIEIKNYAFAYLTNLEVFYQGSYSEMEYAIGDYAFYNCSSLWDFSTSRMAPTSIGKYAFAKTNLGGDTGIAYGRLFDAPLIKEGAFSDIDSLECILLNAKFNYDTDNNTYTINENTFNYKNFEEGWNGIGDNAIDFKLYIDYSYLNDGITLYLTEDDKEISELVFILSKNGAYNINVFVSTSYGSRVSLTLLEDDTEIGTADKEEPMTKEAFKTPDEEYYYYYKFNIYNDLHNEEDENICIQLLPYTE